jgi:hypothetical protein
VEVRIGLAEGSVGVEIPYSTSIPMMRCIS